MSAKASASTIHDISMDDDLNPQLIDVVIDGRAEKVMNADFILALLRDSETNRGRALWREFRKALAQHRNEPGQQSGEKQRATALLDALRKTNHPLARSPQTSFW